MALWRTFPERLTRATGCGALIYSRLGYGRSDTCVLPRPVDFMHHEGLSILPQVIRQCGIRDYLLVGHSDGASIALIHAGGEPAPGLMGVISLAAHVFCEDITRQSIADAGRRYRAGDLRSRLTAYHGENTDAAFLGWHDVWLHPDFRRWTLEPLLPAIDVPVLAIQEDGDPYGTPAQIESIRRNCGGRTTVCMLPGCGHAPHLEQRGAVIAAVVRFLSSIGHVPPETIVNPTETP